MVFLEQLKHAENVFNLKCWKSEGRLFWIITDMGCLVNLGSLETFGGGGLKRLEKEKFWWVRRRIEFVITSWFRILFINFWHITSYGVELILNQIGGCSALFWALNKTLGAVLNCLKSAWKTSMRKIQSRPPSPNPKKIKLSNFI